MHAMQIGIQVLAVVAVALSVSISIGDEASKSGNIYDLKLTSIDGQPIELSKYKGKVLLIVNVASECGMTPQYEGLQALHEKYKEKGLAVLGMPCNQFGAQEPGSNQEIKAFCTSSYKVTFDMFSKIEVKGKEASPLYKQLTILDTKPQGAGPVGWNFEKFLVSRKGDVIARFGSSVEPDSPDLVEAISKALNE